MPGSHRQLVRDRHRHCHGVRYARVRGRGSTPNSGRWPLRSTSKTVRYSAITASVRSRVRSGHRDRSGRRTGVERVHHAAADGSRAVRSGLVPSRISRAAWHPDGPRRGSRPTARRRSDPRSVPGGLAWCGSGWSRLGWFSEVWGRRASDPTHLSSITVRIVASTRRGASPAGRAERRGDDSTAETFLVATGGPRSPIDGSSVLARW